MVVFVAVAAVAAPTYVMAETTIAKVEPKAKSAAKDPQVKLSDWSLTPKTSRLSTTGSRAQVMAMQQTLKDKGFDPGPIDGAMGPRTAAALRDYQKAESPTLTERGGPVAALLMLGILFRDRHSAP